MTVDCGEAKNRTAKNVTAKFDPHMPRGMRG